MVGVERDPTPATPRIGVVLTGGGARAAYQVGVLSGIERIRREAGAPPRNPFAVIAGTSAGAINAAALAAGADRFDDALAGLAGVWRDIRAEHVYRADAFGVVRTGASWLTMLTAGWALTRWRRGKPRALLDNSPLASLLEESLALERIPEVMRGGHLDALAVSGSSYTSGTHVTFYDARDDIQPWTRSQRIAVRCSIGVDHLLASSALPFLFPATALKLGDGTEWFGDGSMRQSAPISPAIHLGSERVLVVGAGRMHEPYEPPPAAPPYPSLAQVAGHALSTIFLDSLALDIERLQRINTTYALLSPEARQHTSLRVVDVLVISPSQRLDEIAARHVDSLPTPVRALLGSVGVQSGDRRSGAALASYLLFESSYTTELMALGEADTLVRREDVARFFGWEAPAAASDPGAR